MKRQTRGGCDNITTMSCRNAFIGQVSAADSYMIPTVPPLPPFRNAAAVVVLPRTPFAPAGLGEVSVKPQRHNITT
jgi:hypothetical protein